MRLLDSMVDSLWSYSEVSAKISRTPNFILHITVAGARKYKRWLVMLWILIDRFKALPDEMASHNFAHYNSHHRNYFATKRATCKELSQIWPLEVRIVGMLNLVLREFGGLAVVRAEVPERLELTQDCEDELIRALAFVVDSDKLDNALQILDDKRLRLFTSPSGRRAYVVSGSHRKQYVCLPDYCTCESFFQAAKRNATPAMVSPFAIRAEI